jgi:hypothetical protein
MHGAVRQMFPKIPDDDLQAIVTHAFKEGTNRPFPAIVSINRQAAYATDTDRRLMGAGIVWHVGEYESVRTYGAGRYTGDSSDTEALAIAAAVEHTKQSVQKRAKYELIRIYSDSLEVLWGLIEGNITALGPLIAEKTSLQSLYDDTDWLHAQGVKVLAIAAAVEHAKQTVQKGTKYELVRIYSDS